jgi:hypothetical protein
MFLLNADKIDLKNRKSIKSGNSSNKIIVKDLNKNKSSKAGCRQTKVTAKMTVPEVYMRIKLIKSVPEKVPVQIGVSVFENFRKFPWITIAKFGIGKHSGRIDFSTGFKASLPWKRLTSAEQFNAGETTGWIDVSDAIYSRKCESPKNPPSRKTVAVCFNSPQLPQLTGKAPIPKPKRIGFKPDCGNLKGVKAIIDFADRPAEEAIKFTVEYDTDISLIALDINGIFDGKVNRRLKQFDYIRPVYESVCEQLEEARKRNPDNAALCRKMVMTTWIHHGYMFNLYDSKTARKQLEWLRLIGFNYCNWFITIPPGINGGNTLKGMSCYVWVSPATPAWLMPDPWREYSFKDIEPRIAFYVDKWKKEVGYKKGAPIWCKVGDEIKLIPEKIICDQPQSRQKFKEWLKAEDYMKNFHNVRREDIKPIRKADVHDEISAKLYYYTCWYRQKLTIAWWQRYVKALKKVLGPTAKIGMESCGISFDKWPDYYLMSQAGFMDHMLHEYTTKLWVPNHYAIAIAEKHRCAEKFGKEQAGGLLAPSRIGTPAGNELICMTALMRGFKNMHCYDFYFNEPWLWDIYSTISRIFRRAARIEDYLLEGRSSLQDAECAVLMSRSTRLWGGKGCGSAAAGHLAGGYLMERNALIAALALQQIPLDVLPEEELLQNLKKYKVLYVTDANISDAAQRIIIKWIKAGGVLCTVSGAAVRNEFNQPSPIWDKLTGREGCIKNGGKRPAAYSEYTPELYKISKLDKVTWEKGGQFQFEAAAARDRINIPNAVQYASFDNGEPAAIALQYGKGRAVHLGFLPAVTLARKNSASYLHDIKHPRNGRMQHDHRFFDPNMLHVYALAADLAGVERRIRVSKSGVDAVFYELADKAIIMLADYDSPKLEYVDITAKFHNNYARCVDENGTHYAMHKNGAGQVLIKKVPLKNSQLLFLTK